jgi:hypothetical protein
VFNSRDSSSGKGLTDIILKFLEKHELALKDCRGPGYDNAANMNGQNGGVKKGILTLI